MQELTALNESIELFFGDFDLSLDSHLTEKQPGGQLYDIVITMDILDEKDVIHYAIYMGLSKPSATHLTKILNEIDDPTEEEVKSTIMEMLNIFGGHAIQDLPPMENEESYYFLAPPNFQNQYVVDPQDFSLTTSSAVDITDNQSKEKSTLYFCLFKKLNGKK